ncbi:MAG: hypothetical protein ACO2PQ_06940, partial [Thermoflexus sp.]
WEAEEVRDALRRLARTRREREVAEHLIRAAKGGGTPGTRAGSLKHLLWWLRDHAGELYEHLARALLERVLENPSLPLHEGLASRLLHDALLSTWVQKALEGARQEDLVACLEWEKIGGFLVAFNPTEANLTKPAMEAGAHLFSQIPPSQWGVEAFIRLLREDPPEEESARPAARAGRYLECNEPLAGRSAAGGSPTGVTSQGAPGGAVEGGRPARAGWRLRTARTGFRRSRAARPRR